MSLFASLGQGDFWSTGYSYTSPINDTLEKESFTLEDLLEEDELLQEVKARNSRLIEFLSQEPQVDKLLSYVVDAPLEESDDLRKFKFPYMSCEVICCEVPDILQILVDEHDGKYLNKLFSILDASDTVNHFLAGYFEKTLEVIFRRKTIQVMSYLNSRGQELLSKFLRHIDNYSIMQIVQRLMLPHIPFSIEMGDVDTISPSDRENLHCNWSFQAHTCDMLTSRMLDGYGQDVPYHISDLLITVVQLSAPDAPFVTHLCQPTNLRKLISAAFDPPVATDTQTQTPTTSDVSLASICVLESLISRLCENNNPFEGMASSSGAAAESVQPNPVLERSVTQTAAIEAVSTELVAHVPKLAVQVSMYVTLNPVGEMQLQTRESLPRLGQRGLQLVKLVEACVRLGLPNLDSALRETGTLRACVDMFFKFEMNSLLHLSVQRIVLMVLEGGIHRRQLQRHLLAECGLLKRMMDAMIVKPENAPLLKFRRPFIGHLIVITQVIVSVIHSESSANTLTPNPSANPDLDLSANDETSEPAPTTSLKDIIQDNGLLGEWDEFVTGEFTQIMTAQTAYLGSAEFTNRPQEQAGVGIEIGSSDTLTDHASGLGELEQSMMQLSLHGNTAARSGQVAEWVTSSWMGSSDNIPDGDLFGIDSSSAMGVPSNGAPLPTAQEDDTKVSVGKNNSTNLFFASFEPSEAEGVRFGDIPDHSPVPESGPGLDFASFNPFGPQMPGNFADFSSFDTPAGDVLVDELSDSDEEDQT